MKVETPASLLAGAKDEHGRHERLESWDKVMRRGQPDLPDALTCGRHTRPADTPKERP